MSPTEYLSQEFDFLGTMATKLQDLQGLPAMAFELIQNADDAPDATEIRFTFRTESLEVWNNGPFRPEDFDRMRRLGSGGKREEADTIGTFGIGFLSVYQVTDSPELVTGNVKWTIRPDAEPAHRIMVERLERPVSGTTVRLPWALGDSRVRQGLRAPVVRLVDIEAAAIELLTSVSNALLFLRKVSSITVITFGGDERLMSRARDGSRVRIESNGTTQEWLLVEADFSTRASELRRDHPSVIEAKRRPVVSVAIPKSDGVAGRYFAYLPTQQVLDLPLAVNADFFPSSDRKRLCLDADCRSQWNREAIAAAARAISKDVLAIRDWLGAVGLWRLARDAAALADKATKGLVDQSNACYWDHLKVALAAEAVVLCTDEMFRRAPQVLQLQTEGEQAAVPALQELGVHIVHPDLREFYSILSQVKVRALSLKDIVEATAPLRESRHVAVAKAPSWLRALDTRVLLLRELGTLLKRTKGESQNPRPEVESLRQTPLVQLPNQDFLPFSEVAVADNETMTLFTPVAKVAFVLPLEDEAANEVLTDLSSRFGLVEGLACLDAQSKRPDISEISVPLLQWFSRLESDMTPDHRRELGRHPIFPAAIGGVRRLDQLYWPGDFEDLFGLASAVDVGKASPVGPFLRSLGIRALSLRTYLQTFVLKAIAETDRPIEVRREMARFVASHWERFQSDADFMRLLRASKLVECTDGVFRQGGECYYPAQAVVDILGSTAPVTATVDDSSPLARLYRELGVGREIPARAVRDRITEVTASSVTTESRDSIERVFRYLATRMPQGGWRGDEWSFLKTVAWLPADQPGWFSGSELLLPERKSLCGSHAKYLSIQGEPNALRSFAHFCGVPDSPKVETVVSHLRSAAGLGIRLSLEVYRFLQGKVTDPNIEKLRSCASVYAGDGIYVEPSRVFWHSHRFGCHRIQLAQSLREFSQLFERIGVRDQPSWTDAVNVLREIAASASCNEPVSKEEQAVVKECWLILSEALEVDPASQAAIEQLGHLRVVIGADTVLYPPQKIFFDDTGRFKDKFDARLAARIVSRPAKGASAMSCAGVRNLRDAARTEILECEDPRECAMLVSGIIARIDCFRRVLHKRSERAADRLLSVRFWECDRLMARWILVDASEQFMSESHDEPAVFSEEDAVVYFVRSRRGLPYAALARELTLVAGVERDVSELASAIKEVLAADDEASAHEALDELLFPRLSQVANQHAPGRVVDAGDFENADVPLPDTTMNGASQSCEARDPHEPGSHGNVAATSPSAVRGSREETGAPAGLRKEGSIDSGAPTPGSGTRRDPDEITGNRPAAHRAHAGSSPGPRLVSYVRLEHEPEPADPAVRRRREQADEAGIQYACKFERAHGREPRSLNHSHPGWDIVSKGPGGEIRQIEVKSSSGEWPRAGVILTRRQYEASTEEGINFWLYVVENTSSGRPRLHAIHNPARKANRYLIDPGWREFAEEHDP